MNAPAALPLAAVLTASLYGVAPAHAADTMTVVLDWTVNTNHTGLFVAQANGYFEDVGLDVAIETPPETGAAPMILSGTAEIGVSYQEEVTLARSAGQPLTAIAAILQHNTSGFAARAEQDIERPADFAGKRYGGWGSPIEEAMLRSLVSQDGGDPDSVDILPIGNMDFFAATENSIDFVWIFEGWDGVAAQLRNIEVDFVPLATVPALDYYTPVLVSSQQWLDDNADIARSFLDAVSRGYAFAAEQPAEAAAILLQEAPELDAELVEASQQYLGPRYQDDAPRWGEMTLQRWQAYADWLDDHELLEGEFDAGAAFSNDYLP